MKISLLRFLVLVAWINDEWQITVTTQTITPLKITLKVQNAKLFLPFKELKRMKVKRAERTLIRFYTFLNVLTILGNTEPSIGYLYN